MVALESGDILERGDEAPDFELRGTDGDTYTLSSFADKEALLLVFTCNHCPYARAKFEEMNRLAEEFDEVAVVGVNPNDPAEAPSEQILSGLLANFSYQVAGNEAVRTPNLWVQQVSQNDDPPNSDSYQYQTQDPNNLWEFWLFSGTMNRWFISDSSRMSRFGIFSIRPEIFPSAEARAVGLPDIAAPPRSAAYSRYRLSARISR